MQVTEYVVDLTCGAIVAVTVQRADAGDTQTIQHTVVAAAEQLEATIGLEPDTVLEVVPDEGYHGNDVLTDLYTLGVRPYTRSRNADAGTGSTRRRPSAPCTRIVGAFAGTAAKLCDANAANDWSGRSRSPTKPGACVARTSEATRTS